MVKHKITDPKTITCIIFASFSFFAMFVFFIVGGTFFAVENKKVQSYANSLCQVDSRSSKTYECQSRANRYTCYGPMWHVRHGEKKDIFAIVEGEKRYSTYYEALNKANEYQIGSSYSCWYDRRNPSIVQWEKPNTTVGVILLSCGGLSVLLTVLFLFLIVQLVKQEILRNKQNNGDLYSHSNSYMKQ